MKKMHFYFLVLMVLFSWIPLFGQAGDSSPDYWMDEAGQLHQIIRWTRANALYYDVEIERRDDTGQWLPVETRRTEDTHLELLLPPGAYRFRIHTFNVLERLAGTSDWTGLRVYEAKAPAADLPPVVEIPRGDLTFIITISGDDLVEDAEVRLVFPQKGAAPIAPLSVSYSFDETWIRAEFSAEDVSRGTYDLVITNPGGLAQTVEGVEIKFVQPRRKPGTAGSFVLDNTKSWGLGGSLNLGLNAYLWTDPEYYEGSTPVIFEAAVKYTFLEKYKDYGKFFFLPNSFFIELAYTFDNIQMEFYTATDQSSLTFEIGALYKIRLDQAQRFLFSFGLSTGAGVGFFEYDYFSGSDTFLYLTIPRIGLSYRITPAWSADFGAVLGGVYYFDSSAYSEAERPFMMIFSLGATYRGFY